MYEDFIKNLGQTLSYTEILQITVDFINSKLAEIGEHAEQYDIRTGDVKNMRDSHLNKSPDSKNLLYKGKKYLFEQYYSLRSENEKFENFLICPKNQKDGGKVFMHDDLKNSTNPFLIPKIPGQNILQQTWQDLATDFGIYCSDDDLIENDETCPKRPKIKIPENPTPENLEKGKPKQKKKEQDENDHNWGPQFSTSKTESKWSDFNFKEYESESYRNVDVELRPFSFQNYSLKYAEKNDKMFKKNLMKNRDFVDRFERLNVKKDANGKVLCFFGLFSLG